MWSLLGAFSLVFGGCCCNVVTFEELMGDRTNSISNLITLCQFLFVACQGLPRFIDFRRPFPYFKPLKTPLHVYIISVVLFYISSTTNNNVFKYNISIPIHIVFRCFGTVITMITCWLLNGRKYTSTQVSSTLFLTIGAIIASLYKDNDFQFKDFSFQGSRNVRDQPIDRTFVIGICMLILSSITSSLLSAYNERAYQKYGKHWKENIFYSHFLSLPLFLLNKDQLIYEYRAMRDSKRTISLQVGRKTEIPHAETFLLFNVLTQYFCVKGVNILASQTNALTLSITLLVRRFVSLLLSVQLFGNNLSYSGYFGVCLVFFGAFIYSLGSVRPTFKDKEALGKGQ
ncbi:yea4p [Saccharomyces arboricola H-6]|uniref:Yea4p n=1 Tax=Saccharomyces arboricola (strain H-6 / AS 2.3317 / CBS 10644) TaxID=1160507 RepID=J8Q634_SACAR|nr:yea4p [Saccharomyces arboricola H-6]